MKTLIAPLWKVIPKPMLFMLVSAAGCFLFALLVEPLLYLTQVAPTPRQTPQSICLTMDISGSMAGDPLREVKEAAKSFIRKRDLSRDKIAIVTFSDYARVIVPFSQNQEELFRNIDQLRDTGGTNFEAAMQVSETLFPEEQSVLRTEDGDCSILLFTDGESTVGNPNAAISTASRLISRNVRVFAIATLDADMRYLTNLTQQPDRVITTRSGDFEDAFARAEKMIMAASQLSRDTHGQFSYIGVLLFTMLWTVFICCGITFFLVGAQNALMKKPVFISKQFLLLLIASVLAGTIAGFISQFSYTILRAIYLGEVGRMIAWAVLGGILASGMVFFIPNLNRNIAFKGGALGGFLGALGFLILSSVFGDMGGRLLGAFILGACIGAMVGIVEVASRKVWLAVVYSPRDVTVVNLGPQTVTVGSGNDDTVLVRDVAKKAAEFRVDGNIVRYKGLEGNRNLEPGARVKLGNVELVVCSQDVPFSPSRFYPMKFSRAQELKSQGKIQ